ncbi:hypothetical protein ACFLXB_09900 [Chloroflexota bacterium]
MEKKDSLSKTLTIIGTILVWLPIAAPFIFGFISLGTDGVYRFDYLMPAEFGFLAFAGGAILLVAAVRTRKQLVLIALGLVIAVASLVVIMQVGGVMPDTMQYTLVVGLLVLFSLAIILMGIAGILLWRYLFRK